ncbi:hypothetical protein VX159_03415 [Dechloromonas sp. ZY10]|uniref:hypothetical protein n=1 Tax=Dechloromonas aquae TaxID=2664436 RepID=UPI00352702B6
MASSLKRQAGRLLPLTLPPLLAGGLWLGNTSPEWRLTLVEQEARALQQAREALLARAQSDDNRPGSLPCPDLLTNDAGLRNYPDDGKSDNLTRNRCPTDIGRLPWATLAQPPLRDRSGERLWLVVAPGLYDDDNSEPINSDTPTGLSHAGQSQIAALLIGPGVALPGQQRPSQQASDYLEALSGNDRVLAISRGELMAAVETRIVNQVHRCLQRHAGTDNYPWPAPLASLDGRGQSGSRFGRVPQTQPEPAPWQTLATSRQQLADTRAALPPNPASGEQQAWHAARSELIASLRNFAEATFTSSRPLALAAYDARQASAQLAEVVDRASSNQRISRSEGSAITTTAQAASPLWQRLPGLLADSGLDPWAATLIGELREFPRFANDPPGTSRLCTLASHLALSYSEHPELTAPLAAASDSIGQLCTGTAASTQLAQAASDHLQQALSNRRSELLAADLEARRTQLLANPQATPAESQLTRELLEQLHSGPPGLLAERERALLALASGDLATAQASLQHLVHSLQALEQVEHNLSVSSLNYWLNYRQSTLAAFIAQDQATPRPLQQAIAPYAQALAASEPPLLQLANVIETYSQQLSRQARAPASPGSSPLPREDSLLASSIAQLELEQRAADARSTAEQSPTRRNQQKAEAALAAALASSEQLLVRSQALLTTLMPAIGSTAAQAWPLTWRSRACDFLRATSDSPGWWARNRWSDSMFYQLGERQAKAPGRLHLGPRKDLPLVVVAAGGALAGQSRPSQRIGDYLEGRNADPGRDGQGLYPSVVFERSPRSTVSNDLFAASPPSGSTP